MLTIKTNKGQMNARYCFNAPTLKTENEYYAVQGLFRGEWIVLFAPYANEKDANARRSELETANPACLYRTSLIFPS